MPYSMDQCEYCETRCQNTIKSAHKELQELSEVVHGEYDDCNRSCCSFYEKNEELLKKCLKRCVDDVSINFADSKSLAENIISRYSN